MEPSRVVISLAPKQAFVTTKLEKPILSKRKRLDLENIPDWIKNDLYITSGYRPQLDTFRASVASLFYTHNEFVNAWSHLLPAFYWVWMLVSDAWLGSLSGELAVSRGDLIPVQLYIACTAGCMILSVSLIPGRSRP